MQPVDVILTSFARFDLLKRTLDSFFKFNTAPVGRFMIFDDFGSHNLNGPQLYEKDLIADKYGVTFLGHTSRAGQIYALDYLMGQVQTPYVFTCEDDWEFYRPGFIEDSIAVLEQHPDIVMCWLREKNDTNGHPLVESEFRTLLSTDYPWKGFSFNPSVKRLADYRAIGSYGSVARFNPRDPGSAEKAIGEWYWRRGYKACMLEHGYVRHIGDGRGIRS